MYFIRPLVLALASTALCACGRIGFDPHAAELDARSSPVIDATEAGLRLNRLTPDGPIFRASDAPLDDYYYLISTVGSQRPSSFVFDSKIYFSIPSKSNDSGAGGWHYKDGEVLIYQTQLNSPADDKHSIAISRTPDMKTFQLPSESILDGYSRAQVFEYQGAFYMVAFSDAALRWQLLRGDSFDSFDASAAQTIELGSVLHGTGAWDDTPLLTDLPGGEPRIAGVDVVDDKVYLFYLAGSFGQLETDPNSGGVFHGTPYDGPRGIGVFELTIPN